MGPRSSKSSKPPTLIRAYLADNLRILRDEKYQGDKFRSVTARNKALERDSGVSKTQIERILSKEQGASVDVLEWLASALGVRPQDLITPYFAVAGDAVTPIRRRKTQAR